MTTRVSVTGSGFIRSVVKCDQNGNRLEKRARGDYACLNLDDLFVTIDPHDEDGDNSGYEETHYSGWNIEHISLEDHLPNLDYDPAEPGEDKYVRDLTRDYDHVDLTESFGDIEIDIADVTLIVLDNKYIVDAKVKFKNGNRDHVSYLERNAYGKSGEVLGDIVYQVDDDNMPFNVKTLQPA